MKSLMDVRMVSLIAGLGSGLFLCQSAFGQAGSVVINELLAAPASDVNGDGFAHSTQDEFIEIVNTTTGSLDISSWTISDLAGVRHVFPSGTVLGSQTAVIVFGGGSIVAPIPGLLQTASSGTLSLNNSSEQVYLKDVIGTVMDTIAYTSSISDVSWARWPDFTGSIVLHNTISLQPYSPGYGNQHGEALPVQLTRFSAIVTHDHQVQLSWMTASETNNYGFDVERRHAEAMNPALTEWKTIAFIQGAGTTTSPKEYSLTDEKLAPGRYAYRIRQLDKNGSFVYTDATEVEVGLAPKGFTLSQNYPNPFNPTTTIEFTLQEDGHVLLRIYDLSGRQVVTLLDEERKAGYFQQVTFDASRYSSGTYFYRLEANGKVLIRKMIQMK